jgi:hypothetical protein
MPAQRNIDALAASKRLRSEMRTTGTADRAASSCRVEAPRTTQPSSMSRGSTILAEHFAGLSESRHRILVMRAFEGSPYDYVAEPSGISKAMVESSLFRAPKRLGQDARSLSAAVATSRSSPLSPVASAGRCARSVYVIARSSRGIRLIAALPQVRTDGGPGRVRSSRRR